MTETTLSPEQRIEVAWHNSRTGSVDWHPGTFKHYAPGEEGEDFSRVFADMDNGWACGAPGFHPDCVRPAQGTVQ